MNGYLTVTGFCFEFSPDNDKDFEYFTPVILDETGKIFTIDPRDNSLRIIKGQVHGITDAQMDIDFEVMLVEDSIANYRVKKRLGFIEGIK